MKLDVMPRWFWITLLVIACAVVLLAERIYESAYGRGSTWWMWGLLWVLFAGWRVIRRWIQRRRAKRAGDLLLEQELPPAPRRGKFSGEVLLDQEVPKQP
ncbi:MAG TPA: hypothetical protein VMT54_00030 [Candidatus Cybelea sp.]|nr:hypothetical protein [Candidatus Cybelea sp.]